MLVPNLVLRIKNSTGMCFLTEKFKKLLLQAEIKERCSKNVMAAQSIEMGQNSEVRWYVLKKEMGQMGILEENQMEYINLPTIYKH